MGCQTVKRVAPIASTGRDTLRLVRTGCTYTPRRDVTQRYDHDHGS